MTLSTEEKLARVLRALQQGDHDLKLKALDALAQPAFATHRGVIAAVSGALLRERGDFQAYKIRAAAARTLAAIGGENVVDPLTYALDDDHRAVQVAAVEALAQVGGVGQMDRFVALLDDDSAPVRGAALRAVAAVVPADQRPYAAIIAHLADRDETVRQVAADILREAGADAVPAMIEASDDPDSTIRGAVVTLLGESGDERARNPLRKRATDDDSSWVKSRAEMALDALPPEQFAQPRVKRRADHADKLEQLRADAPQWSRQGATENMTIEQVEAMLDSLDARFIRGEISEATYNTLTARWQAHLAAIRGDSEDT